MGRALRELLRAEPDVQAHLRDPGRKRRYLAALFDTVAPRYDRFTRWFSYGMDQSWKRELVDRLAAAIPAPMTVLDLACGTGDLGAALTMRHPGARVVGLDLSWPMLREARRRGAPIALGRADMMRLPLPDGAVDAVLAGYALRNAPHSVQALAEVARVLKPGGWLVTLDFYQPRSPGWRSLFQVYLAAAGKLHGWLWHRAPATYGYIAQSLKHYVAADTFSALLRERGFVLRCLTEKLWGGIAAHVAQKKDGPAMPLTNAEVAEYARQVGAIVADAQSLCGPLIPQAFNWQPGPGRWSVGQCLEHLNITERKMLAGMKRAAEQVRARDRRASAPTRHGWIMTWLIGDMEPPVKRSYRTGASFVPPSQLSKSEVLKEFVALHDEARRLLEAVDGYDLGAAKMQSPFFKLLWYKLGSAFALMAAHDRRHLWQAREVVRQLPTA